MPLPLIIGEAPGPNGDPERVLDGAPAARLLGYMGFSDVPWPEAAAKLGEHFELRNLLDRPMRRIDGSKGCEWPIEEAEEAGSRITHAMDKDARVVLLGRRVAGAFGWKKPEFWGWHPGLKFASGGRWAMIPHPSGIVRLYNEPENRVRTGMVMWQAMGRIPI